MDTTGFIAAFTPSKIIIQTSVLPVIEVDPARKSWLGEFLDPRIYAFIGDTIVKIDPKLGKVALASNADIENLPNNWGNFLAVILAGIFAVAVIRKAIKR